MLAMKEMKLLPLAVIVLLITCIGSSSLASPARGEEPSLLHQTSQSEALPGTDATTNEETSYFTWVEPPVPDFLSSYMDTTMWWIDTICVVDGKAYYRANDEYGRGAFIYTLDELLCEDPTLTYAPVDSKSGTTYQVSTSTRSIQVDFADRSSVERLKALTPQFGGFKRFSKDYFADFGNTVLFHLDVDIPDRHTATADNLRRWLVGLVNERLVELAVRHEALGEEAPDQQALNKWMYHGDIRDTKALGRFASRKSFALHKMEYGEDNSDYPPSLFNDLSLRLVSSNGKYYSYQKYTHINTGGVHGYYTEEIVSFVPQANEAIDWHWLFKPGCDEAVLALFYDVVNHDAYYKEWVDADSQAAIRNHFEASREGQGNGSNLLPQPGLTDKGVIFSFQPYDISGFAAGCFHFTIPYKNLKPYLTSRAIELLNL